MSNRRAMHITRHNIKAKSVVHDGYTFPSKKEAAYYEQLKVCQQSGDVVFFLRQTPIHLPGGVTYRVDFLVFLADGTVEFVDVKGVITPEYLIKKKVVEATYPITIKEV